MQDLRSKQTVTVAIDFLNWQLVTGSTSENVKVRVRIGAIEITLPDPLDEPWRELAVNPGNDLTAAHPDSNRVFRGYSPGRHIDASHLRNRLRHVFSTRAARLGPLHELTKPAPVAILAEALGYHPTTIERHAVDSATAYSRYVAAVRGGWWPLRPAGG